MIIDGLGLSVFENGFFTIVTTETGLLISTEGDKGLGNTIFINKHGTGIKILNKIFRSIHVLSNNHCS